MIEWAEGDSSENSVDRWAGTNGRKKHVAGQAEESGFGNWVAERLAAGICEQESMFSGKLKNEDCIKI